VEQCLAEEAVVGLVQAEQVEQGEHKELRQQVERQPLRILEQEAVVRVKTRLLVALVLLVRLGEADNLQSLGLPKTRDLVLSISGTFQFLALALVAPSASLSGEEEWYR
jgi:hypothetical protein